VFVQTRYASGRALGRYQMMSYLPEVQAEVSQVSGGQAWLNKLRAGIDRPQPKSIGISQNPLRSGRLELKSISLWNGRKGKLTPKRADPLQAIA
jgi:hypothetical protein